MVPNQRCAAVYGLQRQFCFTRINSLHYSIYRLLVQLEETGRNFDEFWSNHELRLEQCLQLRKFEEDFKQAQYSVEQHLAMITAMTDSGDTVQRVDSLIKELQDYELEAAVSSDARIMINEMYGEVYGEGQLRRIHGCVVFMSVIYRQFRNTAMKR